MKKSQQMNMALGGPDSLFVRTPYPEAVGAHRAAREPLTTLNKRFVAPHSLVHCVRPVCAAVLLRRELGTNVQVLLSSFTVGTWQAVLTTNIEYLVPQVVP